MYQYQAGLPPYLFNSFSVAVLTIAGCVILAALAGFGLARFSIPYKEVFFIILRHDDTVPDAAHSVVHHVLKTRDAKYADRARHHSHRNSVTFQHLSHAS